MTDELVVGPIRAGEDFPFSLDFEDDDGTPIVLTGSTFALQVRASVDSSVALIDLDSGRFEITTGADETTENRLLFRFTSTETQSTYTALAALTDRFTRRAVFDLRQTDAGDLDGFPVAGTLTFVRSITR